MAYHDLGKRNEAKASLARAEERIARHVGVGDLADGGIENWLICHIALREARARVGK
jgi:hypothetical protein